MNDYPTFGALLNEYLAARDRSPAWLARRLGVNGGTVSRWLNEGARPGSPEMVARIADVLGMSNQRGALLLAAGYGYEEREQASREEEPPPVPAPTPAPSLPFAAAGKSTLPHPLTPFVGRRAEVARLVDQLHSADCRLLTLIGPGGIGKTRLAIEVARYLQSDDSVFVDGCCFVSLLEVSSAAQISLAIAAALGVTQAGQAAHPDDLAGYLASYLVDKRLLLVLDNFEHLLEGVAVVNDLLMGAPHVTALVTSRVALGVPGEWFHPVAGLEIPDGTLHEGEELTAYDGVRLFHQCALRAAPHFDLEMEAHHVQRICQLVDGMPLALELAAAWLRLLPCARIAEELTRNIAALTSPLRTPAARHESLRGVLSYSWQLLTAHEAAVMQTLALFQGGFTEEAALTVASTDLLTLAALVQKSMIRAPNALDAESMRGSRYALHEMLRHFANEQMAAQMVAHPETMRAAMARHSHYFLSLVQRYAVQLLSAKQQEAVALLQADFENVRAAWRYAVGEQHFTRLAQATEGLFYFCVIRGIFAEGIHLLTEALDTLAPVVKRGDDPLARPAFATVAGHLGALYTYLPAMESAMPLLQLSLAHAVDAGLRAFVLGHLGYAASFHHDEPQAEAWLKESLELCRARHDLAGEAYALHKLSSLEGMRGHYEQCYALAQESLAIYRRLGRPDRIMELMDVLGVTRRFLSGED